MEVPPVSDRSATVWSTRDGVRLRGTMTGSGRPVLFMHGLGAAADQAEELVGPIEGARWLMPESRGHGGSETGRARPFSIPMLAADALAFAERCGARRMVAGGISLGAALALHLAGRHPAAVQGLVLVRPAWLFAPAPQRLGWFGTLAGALRAPALADGRTALAADPAFRAMADRSPGHAASLMRWFDHPDPRAAADLLEGVLAGDPGITAAQAASLEVPALVLAAPGELPHPPATARALAAALPRSRLVAVPSRGADKRAFLRAARAAIAEFLAALPPD